MAALLPPTAVAQTGACCDLFYGICQDGVAAQDCHFEQRWEEGVLCADLDPPCTILRGACCDRSTGRCWGYRFEELCRGSSDEWSAGATCFEVNCRPPKVFFVDQHASGSIHDGANWCSAFTTLDEALEEAVAGDTILVAGGTYTPDATGLADPREATFQLKSGVTIEGGYGGCSADDPDGRDIDRHTTVLSGDLEGNDVGGIHDPSRGENAYHVVTARGTDRAAVVDGFDITAGNADGPPTSFRNMGGGIFCDNGSPTIRSCTLVSNTAALMGGALYQSGPGAAISRCRFTGNLARWGGALAVFQGSATTLSNCLFSGNRADWGGGVLIYESASVGLWNCGIVLNSGDVGGGMVVTANSTVELRSSILWGNLVTEAKLTPPIQRLSLLSNQLEIVGEPSTVSIDYTCIQGWDGSLGGDENTGNDPSFIDTQGPDGTPGTEDDDLRLSPDSLLINAGDPHFVPGSSETDLDGHARVLCARIDVGPYEFGMGDSDCDRDVDFVDVAALQRCFAWADQGRSDDVCAAFDFDADGNVDLDDYVEYRESIGGPAIK